MPSIHKVNPLNNFFLVGWRNLPVGVNSKPSAHARMRMDQSNLTDLLAWKYRSCDVSHSFANPREYSVQTLIELVPIKISRGLVRLLAMHWHTTNFRTDPTKFDVKVTLILV